MSATPIVKPILRLDWVSYAAARYAVRHWHYSRSMPAAKTAKIGVWENGRFVGAVVFSMGANQYIGREFGLGPFQCCELTRVALDRHQTPVSRILRIALAMLRKQSPGLRAVVSYADVDHDHHGGIYAASGWIYVGMVQLNGGTPKWLIHGRVVHGRTVASRWGRGAQRLEWLRAHIDPNTQKVFTLGKHKYVFPFDEEVEKTILPLSRPYPKRVRSSDASGNQPESGGAAPTRTLQTSTGEPTVPPSAQSSDREAV
jgi:hypothetical protein